MKTHWLRHTALASSAVLLTSCATAPGNNPNDSGGVLKRTFASDDPCSDNARNIGIASGVLLGLFIGNKAGSGKADSMAAGALVGGLIGGLIGADMDRKRCELSKIAKQYDLDLTFSAVSAEGDVKSTDLGDKPEANASSASQNTIGTSVTVRDKEGAASHFASGSDQLTARAQEYFSAIAVQYAPETILKQQADPSRKEALAKQLAQRHILLIGHTDDTGTSQLNASLSERRARAVASFLKQKGVPESSIYYQGAGETLPIADNRTEAGRAANRRVEIVEVADQAGFKKYLEARTPNYAFYRPRDTQQPTSTPQKTAAPPVPAPKSTASTAVSKAPPAAKPASPRGPATSTAQVINFGGAPYSPVSARVDVGQLVPAKAGFSLISKAQADDTVLLSDCTYDRPRAAGSVKALRDGVTYKTSEHLPLLYGKTWASEVNGNLVVINRVAVLRDGGAPANLPELKVYAQYKPGSAQKPAVSEEPQVNSYLVDKGVLYRMFTQGKGGLKCMDVLFGTDGAPTAKAGKLIYANGSSNFVADFKPQLQ